MVEPRQLRARESGSWALCALVIRMCLVCTCALVCVRWHARGLSTPLVRSSLAHHVRSTTVLSAFHRLVAFDAVYASGSPDLRRNSLVAFMLHSSRAPRGEGGVSAVGGPRVLAIGCDEASKTALKEDLEKDIAELSLDIADERKAARARAHLCLARPWRSQSIAQSLVRPCAGLEAFLGNPRSAAMLLMVGGAVELLVISPLPRAKR